MAREGAVPYRSLHDARYGIGKQGESAPPTPFPSSGMPPLRSTAPTAPAADPPARAGPSHHLAGSLPYLVLTALTAGILVRILALNGGTFVYTLDDPYIHLALAEDIARGTYGVNPGEASAPSSSILYPFLFVPFAGLRFLEWMPLAFGLAASYGTVFLWGRTVGWALGRPATTRPEAARSADPGDAARRPAMSVGPSDPAAGVAPGSRAAAVGPHAAAPGRRAAAFAAPVLVALLILATNLVGVMFTGMEHSLQLFATALLVWGLVVERETDSAPWWLWASLLLGPLLRYENLALTVPALAYLLVRGRRRGSLVVLGLLVTLVGGFSLFLLSLGQGPLPSPVMLKATVASGAGPGTLLDTLLDTLVDNLFLRQGALLALLGTLCAGAAAGAPDREERRFGTWIAGAILLHLLVGSFGWFERYELYIWSATLLSTLLLFRAPLRRLIASLHPAPLLAGAATLTFVLGYPYIYTTLQSPLGSNNIYEQQYQMHRFATDYWDAPVAITDLGWVAFRNDRYVLDLWGLAHRGAAEARRRGDDAYAGELARAHDVGLAMVYGDWYTPPPPGWRPLADMHLSRRLLTAAGAPVTFYSLHPDEDARLRHLLLEFGATLPPGVELSMRDGRAPDVPGAPAPPDREAP